MEWLVNVNGNLKNTTELDYNDLIILYKQFIEKYNKIPTYKELTLKYNMPQPKIMKKILNNQHIIYNDFLNMFGKVKHVRTENINNYNYYVDKFKQICIEKNHVLKMKELQNNSMGLPSAYWLIKNCPDKNVKTYIEFCHWCGFNDNSLKKDKTEVIKQLRLLQENLGRPLIKKDITIQNVGFSNIVIVRIWGSWSQCKKELDLYPTPTSNPKSFDYYKNQVDIALNTIKRNTICWNDIEINCNTGHKSILNAFEREGIDFFSYLKSKGFMMNPSNFSFHYTFESGERVLSLLEYDYSMFLNSIGYKYKEHYQRDIKYNSFCDIKYKTKINCDYCINGKYIEIAGIIDNINNDWENVIYKNQHNTKYKNKMILKRDLLMKNNKSFLFLFPCDFRDDSYKQKTIDFLNGQG